MRAILGLAALSIGFTGAPHGLLQFGAPPVTQIPVAANAPIQTVASKKSDREPLHNVLLASLDTDADAATGWDGLPVQSVRTVRFSLSGRQAAGELSQQVCGTLAASAQAHDLPVSFFSNLIWQESRFDFHSVSNAGAKGIAQFMPGTAAEEGLADPFDPQQALPASARLLRQFKEQFGNLGLAAAAYNAGPNRISKWLAKRASLPRETQNYVKIITGKPAEEWRSKELQEASFKIPTRLPCRDLPEFAAIERQWDAAEYRPTNDGASKHRNKHFAKAKRSRHHTRIASKARNAGLTRVASSDR